MSESVGHNDTDGFVLAAHPGQSQGRPRKLSSSQLIPFSAACPRVVLRRGAPSPGPGDARSRAGRVGGAPQSHLHARKLLSPSRRRRGVLALQGRLGLSERRACQIAGQHRSTQRRTPVRAPDDAALRSRLGALSRERPRWGYRRAHARLLEEGWEVNRKRVQRLWREEGLRVPRRSRKRQRLGESTVPADRLRAERPDQVWALDFQFDQTADGRILKLLHVVDEHTREALAVRCARRIDADKTGRVPPTGGKRKRA